MLQLSTTHQGNSIVKHYLCNQGWLLFFFLSQPIIENSVRGSGTGGNGRRTFHETEPNGRAKYLCFQALIKPCDFSTWWSCCCSHPILWLVDHEGLTERWKMSSKQNVGRPDDCEGRLEWWSLRSVWIPFLGWLSILACHGVPFWVPLELLAHKTHVGEQFCHKQTTITCHSVSKMTTFLLEHSEPFFNNPALISLQHK